MGSHPKYICLISLFCFSPLCILKYPKELAQKDASESHQDETKVEIEAVPAEMGGDGI